MSGKIQIDLQSDSSDAEKNMAKLEARVDELSKANKAMGVATAKAAKAASGSIERLEQDYREANKELKRLEVGTEAFEEQRKKVAELNSELKAAKTGVANVSNEGRQLTTVASKVSGQVVGIAAGFVGISAAVSAISGELEKVKRIQLEAANQTKTFEQSLADIAFNVGGENLEDARTLIEDNAPKLGTTQEGLANLLGVAISAGADDLDEALSVVTEGLKATAGDASKATELVQSALDIASLSGSKNFGGALGQVSQTQAVVRAVNPAEFFANVGPALATATADRDNIDAISTERTLELTSVVSQILKDRTGANTSTAIRQLITRLDAFNPQLAATLKDGSVANLDQSVIDEFRNTRSVDERLEQFRANPELRNQFLAQQEEGIGKSAIAELISGTQRAQELEAKAAEQITSIDEAKNSFDALTKAVADNTKTLSVSRKVDAEIERAQTQGVNGLEGAAFELVDKALGQIDLPGLDSYIEGTVVARLQARRARGENVASVAAELLDEFRPENALAGDRLIGNLITPQEESILTATQSGLAKLAAAIDRQNEEARLARQSVEKGLEDLKLANKEGFAQNKPPAVQPVQPVNAGPVESPVPAAGLP